MHNSYERETYLARKELRDYCRQQLHLWFGKPSVSNDLEETYSKGTSHCHLGGNSFYTGVRLTPTLTKEEFILKISIDGLSDAGWFGEQVFLRPTHEIYETYGMEIWAAVCKKFISQYIYEAWALIETGSDDIFRLELDLSLFEKMRVERDGPDEYED